MNRNNKLNKINFIDPPQFHSIVQSQDFWMDNKKLKSLGFKQDFSIEKTTTIKASILRPDGSFGPMSEKTFYFHKAIGKTIVYKSDYVSKYSGSGEKNLIDGLIGSETVSYTHLTLPTKRIV